LHEWEHKYLPVARPSCGKGNLVSSLYGRGGRPIVSRRIALEECLVGIGWL